LILYRSDGTVLGQATVEADWEPAAEWTRFTAVRQGLFEISEKPQMAILPLWNTKLGRPYLRGFRVDLRSSGPHSATASGDFTTEYFSALAHEASTQLVDRGHLKPGDTFFYVPMATRSKCSSVPGRPERRFTADEVIPPVPVRDSPLAAFLDRSSSVGESDPLDMPVFVPGSMLAEVSVRVRDAGDRETGGILIGQLHRDRDQPEVFIEVTGQIPASSADADLTTLRFTVETWDEVQATLDRRHDGEIMVGWWHSHPQQAWRRKRAASKRKERRRIEACLKSGDFFSESDRRLHRTVFPRAYSIALVVNDLADGHDCAMFGWRQGRIERRGFNITTLLDCRGRKSGARSGGSDAIDITPYGRERAPHARDAALLRSPDLDLE
jgi:hypothetical protein